MSLTVFRKSIFKSLFYTQRFNFHEIPTSYGLIKPNKELKLLSGEIIPPESVHIEYATWGDPSNPIIYVCPSMSNSCFLTQHSEYTKLTQTKNKGTLWWEKVVGLGENYGIDLNKYYIVSCSPLGSPWESTSPLTINPHTNKPYGNEFPRIRPDDQANFIKLALNELNINKLYCIIGGSMGGMQALCYAAMFPNDYDKVCVMATTGWTSPSTVALRHIQRECVKLDPQNGIKIARMIGMICYRSRNEFDNRFSWKQISETSNENFDDSYDFEIESYLLHHGQKFSKTYDPNCYMTLSKCMDSMDLGYNFPDYSSGVLRINNSSDIMIICYDSDYLIPYNESVHLASILGNRKNSKVYHEIVSLQYGHDSFMIDHIHINYRLQSFLSQYGVSQVATAVKDLH